MPGELIFGLMTPTFNFSLRKTLKDLSVYVGIWLFFSISIGLLLFNLGYYDSFLLINSYRNPFLDAIMPHLTHLGEGLLLAAVFSLLIINKDLALVKSLLIALIAIGIVLYTCKNFVFVGWDRPPTVFQNITDIYAISLGGERYNSFPSGHSTAIWMILTFVAYYFRAKSSILQIAIGFLSVMVAYSRVYIGVHYPGDILAGSFIGISIAVLVLSWVYPRQKAKSIEVKEEKQGKNGFLYGLLYILVITSIYFLYQQYYS